MPPKGSTRMAAPRLPPLPKLRVRRPNAVGENPCLGALTGLLACWASTSHSMAACAAVEQQLRVCMDEAKPTTQKKNTINYHLMRMYPKIAGPRRKDK